MSHHQIWPLLGRLRLTTDVLVCVCVYKKGAQEVVRRLQGTQGCERTLAGVCSTRPVRATPSGDAPHIRSGGASGASPPPMVRRCRAQETNHENWDPVTPTRPGTLPAASTGSGTFWYSTVPCIWCRCHLTTSRGSCWHSARSSCQFSPTRTGNWPSTWAFPKRTTTACSSRPRACWRRM